MSSALRSVRHIIDNFSLFGFGNAEAAILQCAKELVENSLDSLKEVGHRGEVQINILGKCDGDITMCISFVGSN
jgi:DNA topoisomerase VI subunit B